MSRRRAKEEQDTENAEEAHMGTGALPRVKQHMLKAQRRMGTTLEVVTDNEDRPHNLIEEGSGFAHSSGELRRLAHKKGQQDAPPTTAGDQKPQRLCHTTATYM